MSTQIKLLNFSMNLRYIRKSLKINQIEFGKRIGLTQSEISKYERGQSYPTFGGLLEILSALDVPLERLVTRGFL